MLMLCLLRDVDVDVDVNVNFDVGGCSAPRRWLRSGAVVVALCGAVVKVRAGAVMAGCYVCYSGRWAEGAKSMVVGSN